MTTEAAKARLIEFGLTEAEVDPLGRWVRIDLVRRGSEGEVDPGMLATQEIALR